MPIRVEFSRPPSRRKQARAAENLLALLKDLSRPQQKLLDALNTRFVFHKKKGESGASDYENRTIELNQKEFTRFAYKPASRPGRKQRWALATLKEETIHYLASYCEFDCSRRWVAAAKLELASRNAALRRLCKAQRKHNSSKKEIKLSLKEYAAEISAAGRLIERAGGRSELAEELLVELLLARDYLARKAGRGEEVHERMRAAFPNTYALALEFEALLEERSETGQEEGGGRIFR